MDLLEQPDIKEAYDKYKLTVKVWEHKFIKQYKRVPSKLDIKEAPKEVREAYKLYFHLKSAALEESFRDVDGFDDDDDDDEDEPSNKTCKDKGESNLPPKTITNPPQPETEENVTIPKNPDTSKEVPKSVWGPHLNHKKNTKKVEEKQLKSNLNAKITKKLFCGSKFSKRNPRKSLSFSHRSKSESMSFDVGSLSQPASSVTNESETESLTQYELFLKNETFNIATDESRAISHPVNLIQSMIDNKIDKSSKNIDVGWLQRVAEASGVLMEVPSSSQQNSASTKLDYDSDDIIEESDEEIIEKPLHVAKKIKLNETSTNKLNTDTTSPLPEQQFNLKKSITTQVPINSTNTLKSVEPEVEQRNYTSNTDNNDIAKTSFTTTFNASSDITNKNIVSKNPRKPKNNTTHLSKTSKNSKKKIAPKKPSKSIEKDINITNNLTPRRSSRCTKVKVSLQEFSSDEEKDPFHSDTDEFPEYQIDTEEKIDSEDSTISNKTYLAKRKKTPKVKDDKGNEEEIADKPFELEFSVKPRLVTPRYTSIKNALKEKKSANKKQPQKIEDDKILLDPKMQSEKKALQKKIASGKLNDNFVRVDITKKVFVRGKRTKSFTHLKKQQWRNKKAKALCGPEMDMGGCDGGTLTCFNCGQTGHFARNCTVKGDKLLPLGAEEEEEYHFPTLEEASKMARENPLKIRTSKINFEEEHVNEATEVENNYFDDELDVELLKVALKLEEEVKRLDVQMYTDMFHSVKPYYELNEDGSIKVTPPEVFNALKNFGHDSFRPGQEQAIMRILSGKSTLVTLSTGSGKSLCYQLPAFMYSKRERCISLVISPLVSLMDDQVTNIAKFMKAACLHSNQTKVQRQKILDAMSKGELSVLLVSPEAVVAGERQTGFGSFLRRLPPIAFACIDEVHCVSQWSHNFRPSYLLICRVLRESLGVKTILGLTATATRKTRKSIIKHLGIPDGENGVISDIPLPDNLILTVSKDKDRDFALLKLLNSERFKNCKSIVIYCTRRDECERIASFLRTGLRTEDPVEPMGRKRKRLNLVAEPYHAGLPASRRRTIQKAFMCGELRIVVATIAFGMGIDKSDIRAVIHYNMPSSFESYVQEVGRAGRDGLEANCHVFMDSLDRDENELRRHIHANSMERHVVRKLLEKVFIPCSCTGVCLKHEVGFSIEDTVQALDIPEENISTLLCYLELHPNKYVELLSPAYIQCKIISYGGPMKIRKAAKECPPLAMALALYKPEGNQNVLEFPIIEVASAMGWESGICKFKLKNLEWFTGDGFSKRSQLSVQFSNLGFRLLSPGNLSGDQLDEALDNLYNRVVEQEDTALCQLNGIHSTLLELAKPSFTQFSQEDSDILKKKIREYFDASNPFIYEKKEPKPVEEESLVGDIHGLISMYRDNNFTGRAIARIFQGIQSPNYPAVIWGRCKFWRSHLDKDFHSIVKIATKEIIKMR